MRSKYALALAVFCLLAFAHSVSRAEKKATKSQKELVPESINRQFAWEEKVVGPKDEKAIDHAKIAALQSQARKEEEERRNRPPEPAKNVRAEGVAAPASVVLPTMDIEKPAPAGSIKKPGAKKTIAAPEPAKQDALDVLLAQNRTESTSVAPDQNMKKVFASKPTKSRSKKARKGRGHRRR